MYLNVCLVIVIPIFLSLCDKTQLLKQEYISLSAKTSILSTVVGVSHVFLE